MIFLLCAVSFVSRYGGNIVVIFSIRIRQITCTILHLDFNLKFCPVRFHDLDANINTSTSTDIRIIQFFFFSYVCAVIPVKGFYRFRRKVMFMSTFVFTSNRILVPASLVKTRLYGHKAHKK